jgi:hypothetical protein
MQARLKDALIYGGCLLAGLMAMPRAFGQDADTGLHLEGQPNPVLAADVLAMPDLREVCFVNQYYSAANLLGVFGNLTVTGRKIPNSADYRRKPKADEIGIFTITDHDQKLIILKSIDGSAPNQKDDGGCFRAEDAWIWHWPDGSWFVNHSRELQIYPH